MGGIQGSGERVAQGGEDADAGTAPRPRSWTTTPVRSGNTNALKVAGERSLRK
jgi:hypothetical protein